MIISAASAAGDSGDTAVSCGLPDGSLAFILSDGMGRGMKAAAESGTAIRRLRKMLRDGVDANRAIRELNRYMVNKSGEDENFATIDMTVIDKSTGKADFYKMGAVTSFLVRDHRVRRIQKPALPVGILPKVKLARVSVRLRPGDVIIMVSDGITEADTQDPGARWLEGMLGREDMSKTGPRVLAEKIAGEACARRKREADDSTVIAVKIL